MCWDPKQLHAWWQKAPLQQSNLLMFILIPADSNLVIKSNGIKTAILNAQRTPPHFWVVITHVAERLWCLCFADHQKLFFFQTFILPLFIYFFFPFLSTVFGLLQEGQVLECSLINSIRVGAVPKVRTQERPFLHFCLHKIHTLTLRIKHSIFQSHRGTPGKIQRHCHFRLLFMPKLAKATVAFSINIMTVLGLPVEFLLLRFAFKYRFPQGTSSSIFIQL